MDHAATQLRIPEYTLEALPSGDEVEALTQIVEKRASQGWMLIEACGDEKRKPVLIFEKRPDDSKRAIKVERIPSAGIGDEVINVRQKLNDLNAAGWRTMTVLDSPITKPIGVFFQTDMKPADSVLLIESLSVGVFENTGKVLLNEIMARELKDDLRLLTIMHGGLYPVLIFGTDKQKSRDEFLVEYACKGVFQNKTESLEGLIKARAKEGWSVVGAFEDGYAWPVVAFRKPVKSDHQDD